MGSRGALMVAMVAKQQFIKTSSNNRVNSRNSENDVPELPDNSSNSSDADSDDEPLSKLLNTLNQTDDDQGQFQIPSQNASLKHLTNPNLIAAQSPSSNVADEDQLLLEVPNSNDAFNVPPDLLNEMINQKVIQCVNNAEEIENSVLLIDNNNINMAPTEDVTDYQPGLLQEVFFVDNENNTSVEEIGNDDIQNEEQPMEQHSAEVALNDNGKRLCKSEREDSKIKRLKGDKYIGYTRSKDGKIKHNKERVERAMKSRCSHKIPDKQTSRTLLCGKVSEETRKKLFKYFWLLPSWNSRQCYIKGLVSTTDIKRRRKSMSGTVCRKKQSHDCFLPLENGEKVLVCRKLLLNTFDIGRNTFERWTSKKVIDEVIDNEQPFNCDKDGTDEVNKGNPKNVSKSTSARDAAKQWLKDLPKVPSHYCRSSSKKLYVESIFRSTRHIYKVYTVFCADKQIKPVSHTLFRKILKSENIAIHKPRKDQCDLCCSWKTGNIPEDVYNSHIRKKDEAEMAKKAAKESLSDQKYVVTMDLQSVLLAPKLEASAVYYKQKLQIHNFTVYALNNKNVDLYVWHEVNGGVSSNEFTTCIVNYIEKTQKEKNYRHIVLISDGCGYQNRNKVLSSALLKLAQTLDITIEQLILERGHTMMEADSVHSSLEAYFKPPLYAPSDYVTRMRQARDHHPYRVHNLEFSFFKNYEKVEGNLTTIKPDKDAKVTDIRGLLYLPTGQMKFKINHSDEWKAFETPRKKRNIQSTQLPKTAQQLHSSQLKISKQKFQHLQELKKILEKDYHPFYDSLPHN